jgi:hypothetical protein
VKRSRGLLTTAIAVVFGAAAAAATALGGTQAALSDAEPAAPSVVAAAEVVLGAGGAGPDLPFGVLAPGAAATVDLTVDYRGSVPAEVELGVAPGSEAPVCGHGGGDLTISVGDGAPVDYCALYDGAPLPLGSVAPGDAPVVAVTVTRAADAAADAVLVAQDVVTVRASAGFVDEVEGRLGLELVPAAVDPAETPPPAFAAAPAPTGEVAAPPLPSAAATPTGEAHPAETPTPAVELPGACAGMSRESFTEVVVLDAAAPSFDAGDRRGPFLVVGSPGDDTVRGSGGADCIVGGGGSDRLSGGAGDDVLAGGAGADVLRGDAGDDRLDGGQARDDLDGGEGADLVDGGAAGAVCPAEPTGESLRCDPAVPQPPVQPGGAQDVAPAAPAELPAEPVAEAPAPEAPQAAPTGPEERPAVESTEAALPVEEPTEGDEDGEGEAAEPAGVVSDPDH